MQKEFYEILINSSVDGILAFDRDCRYILWNPAMERISGMKAEDVLGRCAFKLFPFLRETGEDKFFHEALEGTSSITHKRPYTVAQIGREGFYEGHYSPLYDTVGEIVGGFAIVRDVTEQTRAEDALRASEKLYRDLVENSLGLISTHDMKGELLSVNPAAARMLGYRPEEMVGRDFADFIAPAMRSRVPLYLAQLKHERAGQGLMRVVTRAGEERIWMYRNMRYDEEGRASYVIGHAQDITERVRAEEALRSARDELELSVTDRTAELREANRVLQEQILERERVEEALRESEARFRSLFENATIGLYRTTPDGRILLANPTLIRMLGYKTFEEISRRNLETEGFEPDYLREQFRASLERADLIIGLESSWTKRDGTIISVRESARTIRDASGHVLYYEGTVEDITARKQAEEALHRLADRLTTAQEDEHRRISRTLHDEAGQALTALSVRLHRLEKRFLEQNGDDGHVRNELAELRQIAQSTQEGLRNMAHTLHPSALEHFGLTEAVRGFLHDVGENSEVELEMEVARGFPRCAPTTESAIYRIIQEAVTNALRHAEAKRIRVIFKCDNGEAIITIEDDGRGFDTQSTAAMSGIGLVSMRERAEMIGGQLLISSVKGRGTTVTLRFPTSSERRQ
ncbi:MAG: PAS domain S-box protein [Pyrinomonadaceae bacterium]|nr:PAS domain S-box protein [Pyrinomonadaceae bacterium]